jgi:hypothetical protein
VGRNAGFWGEGVAVLEVHAMPMQDVNRICVDVVAWVRYGGWSWLSCGLDMGVRGEYGSMGICQYGYGMRMGMGICQHGYGYMGIRVDRWVGILESVKAKGKEIKKRIWA